MKLLEDCYAEVLLNERLKAVKITPKIIQDILDGEYQEYFKREKGMGRKVSPEKFKAEQGDVDVIKKVLDLFQYIDQSCENIFKKYPNDAVAIIKGLIEKEQAWQRSMNNIPKGWMSKQPVNLTILRLLNSMLLYSKIPVKENEAGLPVYPYHLAVKFMVMNILEDLIKKKQIDPKVKEQIEKAIFNEAAKSQIQKEIEEYRKRTTFSPAAPKEQPEPVAKEETEATIPEAPSKEERLAMIKRLMER